MDLSSIELSNKVERKAVEAESLPAFSPIKLLHIKRSIAELLKQFGTSGLFEEYTRHDITHINAMLDIVGWLVPEATAEEMQPADWLLIVLGVYFHDLGLLVTKREFENRHESDFPAFCNDVLFAGDKGIDYRAKVDRLPVPERDKFLYQEFVRSKHAARIKQWISGKAASELGVASELVAEIDNLLRDVDAVFRRDLAFICESHHLDDLGDTRKYKTRQPYGSAPAETANLQYAAVLLRTADLLHITKDRTPSITFRTLNPSDPVSQEAWAEQMAIRTVRPQLGRDKDGNVSELAPKDTVEIHAFFQSPPGFFRLTSYLTYAEQQLRQSHGWIETSRQAEAVSLTFPWRRIDQSFIETQGFINEPFEFSLDQAKILDLLTGHTLYNETSVVVRELVQNSLDAVRLQCLIDGTPPAEHGRIALHWNSVERVLTVEDNGTGMTQAVIENHLLKVGSSRYQDPDFKKHHPDFFPISRFGIGVLSCFMIADSVEITTTTVDDDQGRQLTLKSVHGRYLIELLDKKSHPIMKRLGRHGTRIRLELRASADFNNPLGTAKKWIVVPGCKVSFQIDNGQALAIGCDSPGQALKNTLEEHGFTVNTEASPAKDGTVRIKEFGLPAAGLDLAVAVQWSGTFQEWQFLREIESYDEDEEDDDDPEDQRAVIGICIEGVRVHFKSPGFESRTIYALVNARGQFAPQTNVARSSLEDTPEQQSLLSNIYSLYLQHVTEEIAALTEKRHFSTTWAVQEGRVLAGPFLYPGDLTSNRLLSEALANVPLLLAEVDDTRRAVTRNELQKHDSFWTVEGSFYDSAETLLREVSSAASLRMLVGSLQTPSLNLPEGLVLCRDPIGGKLQEVAFAQREPVKIRIDRGQRRLDIQWGKVGRSPIWAPVVPQFLRRDRVLREVMTYSMIVRASLLGSAYVAKSDIILEGLDEEIAVNANGSLWFFSNSPLARILCTIGTALAARREARQIGGLLRILKVLNRFVTRVDKEGAVRSMGSVYEEYGTALSRILRKKDAISAIEETNPKVFNPHAWTRREDEDEDDDADDDIGFEYG